jgi:hypothetical protein
MSLEFKFRRTHFAKENEFLDRISTLLSAMSMENQKSRHSSQLNAVDSNINRASNRTQSLSPKFTLFQFSLPINIKDPIISFPTVPAITPSPTKKPRICADYKNKVPRFIKPKENYDKETSENFEIKDNMFRYKKILNLTQDLIDKDSLKGWT